MIKEIRKNIEWYNWLFQVSNFWDVKKKTRKINMNRPDKYWNDVFRIVRWWISKQYNLHWYRRVAIKNKQLLVHRLVYCTFNNLSLEFKWQKTKTLICHKNDIKWDNRLENLFLWTQYDNVQDCINKWRDYHPKIPVEKRHWKINLNIARKIRKHYTKSNNIYKTAEVFDISYWSVSRIVNHKQWWELC